MAVAQIPELGEVHCDAATLAARPVRSISGLNPAPWPHPRPADQRHPRGDPRDLLAEAEEAAATGRSPDQAWTFYLEYTIGDDAGSSAPVGSRCRRRRPVCGGIGVASPYPYGSASTACRNRRDRRAAREARAVGSAPRRRRHPVGAARTAAGDAVVQSARTAVRRAAAVALLDPGTAPDLLTAVGPFGEPTQRVVVRPALEDVVASSMRRRGERVPPAVLRWLYPELPTRSMLGSCRPPGRGTPCSARSPLRSPMSSRNRRRSCSRHCPMRSPTCRRCRRPHLSGPSRGTAEVERLLAGRSWGPAALRALVGRMSRSPALQEAMLRLVLTHRMDDDLADLLTDLDETTRTWSSDSGRGSDGALRGAVQLCRLADTWWRGPESESASHAARGLVETVEPLLDPRPPRGLPVTEWREQLAGSVVAATAVATVRRPYGEGFAPLDQRLLHADIDHHEAVRLLDRALSNSVLSEVDLVLAALGGAPDYPLAATVPASVLDLGRTEVTADGQRGRLLELVVRRRADRQEMAVHDVNERVLRLVATSCSTGRHCTRPISWSATSGTSPSTGGPGSASPSTSERAARGSSGAGPGSDAAPGGRHGQKGTFDVRHFALEGRQHVQVPRGVVRLSAHAGNGGSPVLEAWLGEQLLPVERARQGPGLVLRDVTTETLVRVRPSGAATEFAEPTLIRLHAARRRADRAVRDRRVAGGRRVAAAPDARDGRARG